MRATRLPIKITSQRDTPSQNENVVINRLIRLQNTIEDILDENREACECPIDCTVNCTVKVHKSMKDVIKTVHLPSDVQSEFYYRMRTLHKKNIPSCHV